MLQPTLLKNILLILLYVFVLFGVLLTSLLFYHHTNEDAWISFNYARHLAEGYGLVINPGGVTQEGYSNLVLVLLLAGLNWAFQADIVHTAKIIGILSLFGIILLAPAIVRLLLNIIEHYLLAQNATLASQFIQRKQRFFHIFTLLLIVNIGFSSFMSYWATQGLETLLYALVVWGMVYLTLEIVLNHHYERIGLLALLGFISLNIRPEGLMNFIVAFGVIFLATMIENKWEKRFFIASAQSVALFAGLLLILIAFKWFYFGSIVSNPSYVKLAISIWFKPLPYFINYFNIKGAPFTFLTVLGLSAGGIIALWLLRKHYAKPLVNSIGLLLAFLASQAFFIYYVGGDYMSYSRFMVTHYPILILAIMWFSVVFMLLTQNWLKTYGLIILGAVVSVILIHATLREFDPNFPRWYDTHFLSPHLFHQHHNTGYHTSTETLNQKMAKYPDSYYATSEFGYVPYHVKAKGLDIIGLNQKEIARNFKLYPLDEVFYVNRDFILSKQPKIIVTGYYYRQPDGEIVLEPAVKWHFSAYIESAFFWHNYHTDVPSQPEEWTFSYWNEQFRSTHSIKPGDKQHYDKLMHGFEIEPNQIWVAPLARVLLQPREQDKFLNLEVYIPDIKRYPQQQNVLEVRVNDWAVGDKLFARHVITQAGLSVVKVAVNKKYFPVAEDILITLRGSQYQPTNNDQRKLSYLMSAIYFSAE